MSNRKELRQAVARAIRDAQLADSALDENDELDEADAAIRALSEEGRLRGEAEAERDAKTEQSNKWYAMYTRQAEQTSRFKADAMRAEANFDAMIAAMEGPELAGVFAKKLKPVIDKAYSAGWIAGRNAAAEVAYKFNGAQHAAHDIATGLFPKQSAMQDAIATAIRALKPPTF